MPHLSRRRGPPWSKRKRVRSCGVRLGAWTGWRTELPKMPLSQYRLTPRWQSLRNRLLFRAGNRCELCYESCRLHGHHRTYKRYGQKLLSDLIALCRSCTGTSTAFSQRLNKGSQGACGCYMLAPTSTKEIKMLNTSLPEEVRNAFLKYHIAQDDLLNVQVLLNVLEDLPDGAHYLPLGLVPLIPIGIRPTSAPRRSSSC